MYRMQRSSFMSGCQRSNVEQAWSLPLHPLLL
jgi:hypothetical protein